MAKSKKTKASTKTVVTFLLDRSGSMQAIKDATIEGFNGYIDGLKEEKETDISFTFLTFDTGSLDKVCVAEPISTVKPLTHASYQPRGGTPLIDASVKTIRATEAALNGSAKKTRVVVCIQTDGHENASSEHTAEELRALVAQKQGEGWEFLFMGAGIDAYSQAAVMGIGALNTMSYDHTDLRATRSAFVASSLNTRAYGSARAESASYSVGQRKSAGDAHWDKQAASQGQKVIVTPRRVVTVPTQVRGGRPKAVPDFTL